MVVQSKRKIPNQKHEKPELKINNNFENIIDLNKISKKSKSSAKI